MDVEEVLPHVKDDISFGVKVFKVPVSTPPRLLLILRSNPTEKNYTYEIIDKNNASACGAE